MRHRSLSTLLLALFIMLGLSGCGEQSASQVITNVHVATKLVDGNVFAEISALFNLGNTALPSLTLPITDPRNGKNYGTLRMAPTFDGKNEIGVSVNMTEALKLQGGKATLPNGNALPVGGISGVDVIEIKIPNTLARIYISLDHGVALAGFAIGIRQLDSIGSSLGNLNFFPRFQFDKVIGIAGIFSGSTSGSTGIALFVDLSSVLNQEVLDATPTGVLAHNLKGAVSFGTVAPAKAKRARLEYELFKFGTSSKKKFLSIH